ncbi:uncharacterized protein ATC70_005039 [Mucor velutinosus]|uniref:PIN domain-like protein n=1 Tax=Mucor velutinosus TaxID=708070 RepID=A0AAN7HWJ0_9FUNG|nr:hypothetical protein ATC70_005039 [Mucor velutinosus]
MGVQGLWSLVGPAARPTQLESMRQKRVAVDASIWIHQFMRTMRDKEGNALRNGHLMGFFRRICKLLFFDIKPVFVFDGGAPTLKRSTIRERRKRREGVKENLKVTAKKILSAQVKSRVLYQEEQKLHGGDHATSKDQEYIYYDAAKDVLSKKRKLDQFELPEVDSIENRTNKLDPRLSTHEEIRDFVNEFDPNELDIDSEAFFALPPEVQYEVIQDMMWKSRSTSWARLDEMVRGSKTALDFSKQQIKLLKHRNKMSQRLMQANNASSGTKIESTRVAGERGRQYMLYKNEDISQGLGWKLPGLSAAEPVILDPTATADTTRPEPKLEVPDGSDFKPADEEPTDKVAAAMAANPKLAALFDGLLSDDDDDEEEEEEEEEEEMEDVLPEKLEDDKPLFENNDTTSSSDIVNDMRAYVVDDDDDDAAMNQVISRIYDTDNLPQDSFEEVGDADQEDGGAILSLSTDDFYKLWLSRVPDAFLYLHSFNDEYKAILKKAIDEPNLDQLNRDLQSVRRQFGKTNEGDELTLEALKFQEAFLESTCRWREQRGATQQAAIHSPPLYPTTDKNIILDDNDEDDIQFVDASTTKDDASTDDEARTASNYVHLDILQSSLYSTAPDTHVESVNNNNTTNNVEKVNNIASPPNDSIEPLSQHSPSQSSAAPLIPHAEPINDEAALNDPVAGKDAHLEAAASANLVDHGYNSEDEVPDVRGEEDEYARFVSDIASKKLEDVRTELYKDLKELNKQQRKELGNSDDITDQMVRDIQELLKLFGIPYLVSPMEAEAQCATLEALKLVDGTVTDDSDVFLFGASRVYKNMFNQQRYVECYLAQDVEREMLLTRKKLIQLAFLLGSDYTEGIPGVGPVAAMEILSEFSGTKEGEDDGQEEEEEPLEAPLKRFKEWYNKGVDETPFQRKFRKRHDALDIPDDFPNPLVIAAYYHPTVDDSAQKFEWGQPQLDSLRIFLTEAFGWSEDKADQVLLPVLREMNSRKSTGEQTTIGSFFGVTGTVSSGGAAGQGNRHSSKRVQSIVDNWRKKQKKSKKSK